MKHLLRLTAVLWLCVISTWQVLAQTCTTTNIIPYTTAPATNPTTKKTATESDGGISFTYSGYGLANSTSSTLDLFEHSTLNAAQISGPALIWRQQRAGSPIGTATNSENDPNSPYNAYVTVTFDREVSNLTFVVQDIDKGLQGVTPDGGSTYTDEFILSAKNAAGTAVTLPSSGVTWGPNKTSDYISYASGAISVAGIAGPWQGARGNSLNGTSSAANANGTTTFTFPSPVKTVVLSFRNLNTRTYTAAAGSTTTPSRLQTIGIQSISWCGQADVTTTLAAPASLSAGVQSANYTATFTNNGPGIAASTTRTVTVPANTASAVATGVAGASVTGSQAAGWTITFPAGANVASGGAVSYNFTVTPLPVASIAVTSTTSTTDDEGANTATNTATVTTNVTPIADLTTTLTGPGSLTAGLQSGNYTVTYTNNGPSVAASTTRTVTIPNTGNVSSVSAPGSTLVTGTATTNWVITYPAGTNVAAGAGGAVSYNFTVTPSLTSTGNPIAVNSATVPGTGGTSEGANTATNSASVSYTVGSVADVSASFSSGQADNSTVAAGATVTYGVTFTNAGPSTATGVTRTVSIPAGVPSVTAATGVVTGSQAAGWTITYPGGNILPANTATYSFSIGAPASGPITLTAATTTTTGQGANALADSGTRTLNVTPVTLSGTVYDDVNYGGGSGRTFAAANSSATASGFANNAIGRAGATVEIYSSTGAFVGTTTTGANGAYSYNLPVAGTYTVRVVNSTVTSVRTPGATGVVPVQTYVAGNANRVGGESPKFVDAAANTGTQTLADLTPAGGSVTPESIYTASFSAVSTTGIDFGFNFDTVVNTNDVATVTGNNAQGSLRQFILNANALSNTNLNQAQASTGGANPAVGTETSIFMIPDGLAHQGLTAYNATTNPGLISGLNANGVAVITAANSALPSITDASTSIDGTTQTQNVGNTNNTTLGAGGASGIKVGTASTTLSQLNGPEVQIVGTQGATGSDIGLNILANSTTVTGIAIYGFGNTGGGATGAGNTGQAANIVVGAGAVSGITLTGNVIGTAANSFTDPGNTARTTAYGILFSGNPAATLTTALVSNNLIGFNGTGGVEIRDLAQGNGTATGAYVAGTSTGIFVENNEIRNGSIYATAGDGVSSSVGGGIVRNNLFANNAGPGVDILATTANMVVYNNTISGNGVGNGAGVGQTPGIRVNGSGSSISQNVISGNYGAGVLVRPTASNTTITQNSIFDNGTIVSTNGTAASGQLGIDLVATGGDINTGGTAPNVTVNDNGDSDTGGNGLINFPVIQSATIRNGNLIVTGFATQNSVVELFVADNLTTTNSFGQGKTYLVSRTEGLAGNDGDATTGTYTTNINGLNQGTETGQQRFLFTIPLSSLSAAQLSALNTTNAKLTATATLATLTNGNQGTSEFSGTAAVLQAPTANNDFATTTANPAAPVTFSAIANDTPADGSLVGTTINLNPNNIAGQTAATFTVAGQGTFTTVGVAAGSVKFTPANSTFTGNVTIPYVISNSEGIVSNQANLTVSVTPVLDLVTAITGPANNSSVTAGAALSYTVTAQNASVIAANNVTQTLQLVPGLTSNGGTVSFTINGTASAIPTYDNTTGLVNFTPSPVALAASTTNTYVASFTKAPASGPVTATANIGSTAGSNGPELNRTNNFATNTVTITPSYDVATTITGSVDGAGAAASVVSGSLVTYLVRTSNSATAGSPAPGVIQTVTFDGNLTVAADGLPTGLYISNGGTAAYNSGTNKTVVTFPTLSTLPIGQTVTNTISFAAPAATYSATANVQANGAATPGATNPGDTNTGAGSNDVATLSTTVVAGAGTPANVYTTINSNQSVTTAGTTVTLTVVAGNRGAGTANTVVQQVQLPAGLTGPGAGSTVVVNNGTYNSTTGIVTFTTIGSLAPQATNSLPFSIQFTAPATGPVLATATVRAANADPVPADNVAEVKVDINSTTDVSTSLAGPATATVGQVVTYAVTTANPGANTAYNVVQTVQLPAGLNANGGVTFAGTTTGTYDNASGVATFTLASPLAAGSRQVNNITFTVPASVITDPSGAATGSNQLAVLAAVRTSTTETSSTNNSAATVMAVTPAADVTVAVSGPASALPGSPVTYAVTTTNNGPVPVASIVPTLQLPAGLTTSGGTVLINGAAAGASYDNATGLVTFATVTNLPNGGSVASTVTVQMPDVTQLVPVARAQVGSATIDTNLDNNRADALTTITNTSVVGTADLATNISVQGGATSVTPGASITLNATFSNLAGGITATTVVPRVQLPAGLANGGNAVTVSGGTGGVYNNVTGLVTWNSVASLASGAAALSGYNVTFKAPASGSVTGTSFVSSAVADAVATNNANSTTITVTPQVDVTTSVKGPAIALTGSRVTYAIVTANNGPSPSGVVTQTVTIPATATNISFPAGSTQAAPSGGTITITFPLINTMSVTPAGDVVNYVSFDAPNANYTVSATASTPGDTNTGNNTVAMPFATAVDQAPTAYDVVNTLPSFFTGVIGSTAGPIKISPLTGSDADAGQTATLLYTLTSLPAPGTGVLYLDAAGTSLAQPNVGYTATQMANLYFDPRGTILATDPTYVGNVTFSYTTTDIPGLTSAPALYTIAVGKDEKSTAVNSPTKGRTVKYQNNDVVANLIDVNTVKYNADGSLPFGKYLADRSVNPTPANTGLTSVVQTGGTLATGLAMDATTGQLYVLDRTLLKSGTYSITVATIDANGGTNTLTYSYTIGDFPLPVELTDFTATAVKNVDAALLWHTAQEKNNDHFEVERSLNGTDFVKIGEVKGQGSKTTATEYALTDAGIGPKAKGLVYYRLKQVDTDGETSYSPVRTVTFTTAITPAIALFPNPATTGTQLDLTQLPTGRYQVSILDATGRIVLNTTLEAGLAHALDLNTIASGTYNLLVRGQANGQPINLTKRLIKE
ncbi:T9SS type A sorting domain-containing protein [Hymenobacter ruber]